MINHYYPNSDESQAQAPDASDQDSQYTPTPGYEHTPLCSFALCRAAFFNQLTEARALLRLEVVALK